MIYLFNQVYQYINNKPTHAAAFGTLTGILLDYTNPILSATSLLLTIILGSIRLYKEWKELKSKPKDDE